MRPGASSWLIWKHSSNPLYAHLHPQDGGEPEPEVCCALAAVGNMGAGHAGLRESHQLYRYCAAGALLIWHSHMILNALRFLLSGRMGTHLERAADALEDLVEKCRGLGRLGTSCAWGGDLGQPARVAARLILRGSSSRGGNAVVRPEQRHQQLTL